jgi:Domain of unknown function DUF29
VAVSNSLYERDFYAWANQQAALLRDGRLAEADIEKIAEEIESMGRSEKRELVSRLTILLQHLLKWHFQPGRRSVSWGPSIENTRLQLEDRFARTTFPADCPYAFEQAVHPDFWPE